MNKKLILENQTLDEILFSINTGAIAEMFDAEYENFIDRLAIININNFNIIIKPYINEIVESAVLFVVQNKLLNIDGIENFDEDCIDYIVLAKDVEDKSILSMSLSEYLTAENKTETEDNKPENEKSSWCLIYME